MILFNAMFNAMFNVLNKKSQAFCQKWPDVQMFNSLRGRTIEQESGARPWI